MKWRDLAYTYATWENLGEDCGLKGVGQFIQQYEALRRLMDPRKKDKKEKKRGRRRSKAIPEVSTRKWNGFFPFLLVFLIVDLVIMPFYRRLQMILSTGLAPQNSGNYCLYCMTHAQVYTPSGLILVHIDLTGQVGRPTWGR